MITNEVVDLLGKKVKDKMSGFTDYISNVCFDLYGCIQVIINPAKLDKESQYLNNSGWVDLNRIEILKGKRIMEHPDFNNSYTCKSEVHGASIKPNK